MGLALILGQSENWAAGLETCKRDFRVAREEEQTLWWIPRGRRDRKPGARGVLARQWSRGEEQRGAERGLLGQGGSAGSCHCKNEVLSEGNTVKETAACHCGEGTGLQARGAGS